MDGMAGHGFWLRTKGADFVFRSKRADRIELLAWDGTGIIRLTKRAADLQVETGAQGHRTLSPTPPR